MDEIFARHDFAYEVIQGSSDRYYADKNLIEELKAIDDDPTNWTEKAPVTEYAKEYRKAVITVFEKGMKRYRGRIDLPGFLFNFPVFLPNNEVDRKAKEISEEVLFEMGVSVIKGMKETNNWLINKLSK